MPALAWNLAYMRCCSGNEESMGTYTCVWVVYESLVCPGHPALLKDNGVSVHIVNWWTRRSWNAV